MTIQKPVLVDTVTLDSEDIYSNKLNLKAELTRLDTDYADMGLIRFKWSDSYDDTNDELIDPDALDVFDVVATSENEIVESMLEEHLGKWEFTLTGSNFVSGDVITVAGTDYTAGTDFTVGDDLAESTGNLQTELDATARFTATVDSTTITLEENDGEATGDTVTVSFTYDGSTTAELDSDGVVEIEPSYPELNSDTDYYFKAIVDSVTYRDEVSMDNAIQSDGFMNSEIAMDGVTDSEMAMDRVTDSEMAMDRVTDSEIAMDKVTDKEMPMDKVTDKVISLTKILSPPYNTSHLMAKDMSSEKLWENGFSDRDTGEVTYSLVNGDYGGYALRVNGTDSDGTTYLAKAVLNLTDYNTAKFQVDYDNGSYGFTEIYIDETEVYSADDDSSGSKEISLDISEYGEVEVGIGGENSGGMSITFRTTWHHIILEE